MGVTKDGLFDLMALLIKDGGRKANLVVMCLVVR